MLTSLFGRCIGVFAVVCVLLMFLFPLPQGNFQATHGPMTALRSKRTFLVLVFTIIRATLQLFVVLLPGVFSAFRRLWARARQPESFYFGASAAILRC